MSQHDRIVTFRQTLLGGMLIIGSGVLFYIIFLFTPCGLGTNLDSFNCLLAMNIIFPMTYGLFGVAWIVKYKHYSKTLVNFNLPEIPEIVGTPLDLPSELLLLAGKKCDKNYFPPKASWAGVHGAILCELILQKALILEGKQITPVGAAPRIQDNLLLNTVYLTVKQHGSSELIDFWFEKLSSASASLVRYTLERLTQSAILQKRVHQICGRFSTTQYIPGSMRSDEIIRNRLNSMFNDSDPVDIRGDVLFALADGCSLLRTMFPKRVRKAMRRKVNLSIATLCPEANMIIKVMDLSISLSELVVV